MTTPCADCPFLRKGGIPLTKDRIREIGGMMLSSAGGEFPCHRTVEYDDEGEESVYHVPGKAEIHCAGALAFAEKHGNSTQMMRICERLGLYDSRKITDEVKNLVWNSLKEWLKHGSCR